MLNLSQTSPKYPQGFTIIEVMVVLAISAALGIIGLLVVSGTVNNISLKFATNDFVLDTRQSITDNLGSYLNGYDTFTCTSAGNMTPVTFSSGPGPGGASNPGCIFLGTVVQFSPDGQPGQFIDYPIAGNQTFESREVETLAEAVPVPIVGSVDLSRTNTIGYGVTIAWVKADSHRVGALGFMLGDLFGNLSSYSGGNLNSDGLVQNLFYISGSTLDQTQSDLISLINASNFQPASTGEICLNEDNGKSVLITIDGLTNLNVTSTDIDGSSC
jgi:prepilin-type N-terminal cleavage/methylation domain-containing protein